MASGIDCKLEAEWRPAPNFGPRRGGLKPVILLLHYTGMESAAAALDILTRADSGVSCHYLAGEDGTIVQMVSEKHRAWHAGKSFWRGIGDVNSASIGIEIVNPGHELGYKDFPQRQIEAVIALCRDILSRHPIEPRNVLAHSDVAPLRKQDPGEKFPWERLHEAGIGHWVRPERPESIDNCGGEDFSLGQPPAEIMRFQAMLGDYGYQIEPAGIHDAQSLAVTRAFQRHFRPARVDGRLDPSTMATLANLLDALPDGGDNGGCG